MSNDVTHYMMESSCALRVAHTGNNYFPYRVQMIGIAIIDDGFEVPLHVSVDLSSNEMWDFLAIATEMAK